MLLSPAVVRQCGNDSLRTAPAMPARIRLITVTTSRMDVAGINQTSHAGIGADDPIHRPSAPNSTARSLLPIGPSYRRPSPKVVPSAPANSVMIDNTITTPTPVGPKGATNANGAYRAASDTTSPS